MSLKISSFNVNSIKMRLPQVINWLKERGFERVEAPINFGERDKYWGLLVKGFDSPSYQENYNFPYYQHLYETYGFRVCIEQTTSIGNPNLFDISKY